MPSNLSEGAAEGRRRKKKIFDKHELEKAELRRELRRQMVLAMLRLGRATIDDAVPGIRWPAWANPSSRGNPCGGLPFVRRDGDAVSRSPTRNASYVSAYRIIDRVAAEVWLAAHPATIYAVEHQRELF